MNDKNNPVPDAVQDKLRLEAAEVLCPYKPDIAFISEQEHYETWLHYLSNADLAEMLRVKITNADLDECQRIDYTYEYFIQLRELCKADKIDNFTSWLLYKCTPIQRMKAAIEALKE